MRRKRIAILALLTAAAALPTASLRAQPLIGDPVPHLGDQLRWLVGEPVPSFEPGYVYLLDFWATWCPPCYPMIDHLSELEIRYGERGLIVIGITIGTDVGVPLPTFLEREADRIAYRIAVPLDEEALKTALVHKFLMDPANFGPPFVMLIDRQGRLAWVNDPNGASPANHTELDAALAAILEDTFDVEASSQRTYSELARSLETRALLEQAQSFRRQGRPEAAIEPALEAARSQPREAAHEAVDLFQELLCRDEGDLASSYGRDLLETAINLRVTELVRLQRSILAFGEPDRRDFQLAEDAARHTLDLQGHEHPDFLFELAKVLAAQGSPEAEEVRRHAAEAAVAQGFSSSYVRYIRSVALETALRRQGASLAHVCRAFSETKETSSR